MTHKGSCHCGHIAFGVEGDLTRHGVQLLALQPQGLPPVVRAARQPAARYARKRARDLPVQQARHQPPLLPRLRLRAVRLRQGPGRRRRGRRQRPLPRMRRTRNAQDRTFRGPQSLNGLTAPTRAARFGGPRAA